MRQSIEEKCSHGGKRLEKVKIFKELCKWKGLKMPEAEACPNHIHISAKIPPKIRISEVIDFLKGKVF